MELDQLKYFLIRAKELLLYHDYLIFRALAFTGLRKGELAALFGSDFDEINQTISVSKTAGVLNKKMYISTPKTKQAYRLIRLDDITFSELKQWRRQQKKELLKYGIRIHSEDKQHIFHRKNNTVLYPEYINDLLSDKLKVNFTPHSFRHTHASLLFEP